MLKPKSAILLAGVLKANRHWRRLITRRKPVHPCSIPRVGSSSTHWCWFGPRTAVYSLCPFAGGGAACSVFSPDVWGYSSGNVLLIAAMLGRVEGEGAVVLIS